MKGIYLVLILTVLIIEVIPYRVKRETGTEDESTPFQKISEFIRKYRKMFSLRSRTENQETSTDFPFTELTTTESSTTLIELSTSEMPDTDPTENTDSVVKELNLTRTTELPEVTMTEISFDEMTRTGDLTESFMPATGESTVSPVICNCAITATGSTAGCSSGETIPTTWITSEPIGPSPSQLPPTSSSAPTENTATSWTSESTDTSATTEKTTGTEKTTTTVSENGKTSESGTTKTSTTPRTEITEETEPNEPPTTTTNSEDDGRTETMDYEVTVDLSVDDATTDFVTNTSHPTALPITNTTDTTDTTDWTTEDYHFPNFDFLVRDERTGVYCTLCKMAISLTVPYKRNDGIASVLDLHVPRTAQVRGACGKKDSWMTLSWTEETNEQNITDISEMNNVSFVFVNDGKSFFVGSIKVQVWLDKNDSHDDSAGRRSGRTSSGLGLFLATLKSGIHTCELETKVNAGDIGVSITGVSLIAFNEQNDVSTRTEESCVEEATSNVGAIVGIAFVGVIVLAIAALFVWRRRKVSRIRAELP